MITKRTTRMLILGLLAAAALVVGPGEATAARQRQDLPPVVRGRVIEVHKPFGTSDRVYARLAAREGRVWVAMPGTTLPRRGAVLSLKTECVRTGFRSQGMNRTLDTVIFTSGPAGQ
ncbi:MAG: hypothetical protein AB1634_19345 [Thermodesulfobacteriota bacterium]